MINTTTEERIIWRIDFLNKNHISDDWSFNKDSIISILKDVMDENGWTATKMKELEALR